jgi:hypothetical protein
VLPREQIIVGKLLWDGFYDFLKFSLKFREQIPYREVASNALTLKIKGKIVPLIYEVGLNYKSFIVIQKVYEGYLW